MVNEFAKKILKFGDIFLLREAVFTLYILEREERLRQEFYGLHKKALLDLSQKNDLLLRYMTTIAIVAGGALINATAFVPPTSYHAKYLIGDQNSVEEEKRRNDVAVEKYQAAFEKSKEN